MNLKKQSLWFELKTVSDEVLIQQLMVLVQNERKILIEILWHLDEMETRKVHLIEGYPSLFAYCTEVLQYSSSQAYRRIAAMRLLRDVPQVEGSVETGKLNLTHLNLAQEYFREEKRYGNLVSEQKKIELLSSLENKTTREAEKIVHKLSPELVLKEKERVVTDELTEIRFIASEALFQKLKRFKEVDSHVQVNPSYAELFERLVDLALKQKDPKRAHSSRKVKIKTNAGTIVDKKVEVKNTFSAPKNPRFIPAQDKKEVLRREQGVCTYQNPKTGIKCGSKFQLQYDHVIPIAKGGATTEDNLRLRCRQHNLLEAERVFGKEKMRQFRS